MPARPVIVLGAASPVAAIGGALGYLAIGAVGAIFMFLIVDFTILWFVEGRSKTGLKLKIYLTIKDTQKAQVGTTFCCGIPIDPLRGQVGIIERACVPVIRKEPEVLPESPFAEVNEEHRQAAKKRLPLKDRVFRPKVAKTPPKVEVGSDGPGASDVPSGGDESKEEVFA